MTWKEFKDGLEAQGVDDDSIIRYIDVSFPDKVSNLDIEFVHFKEGKSFWVTE